MIHSSSDPIMQAVARHWGFSELRPLQRQTIDAVLGHRDSLLVVPTGGGKSLCYQVPAVLSDGVTVVISPLISLMKDQVDALTECGVAAAQMNSSQERGEQQVTERDLVEGKLKLLFVSPERMAVGSFRQLLHRAGVTAFAVDEAHCISHWGHDFRPEYRQLRELRTLFPDASIHAFTATATEQVRRDIVEELGLRNPLILVGELDRPNLTYRILPRRNELTQIEQVLARHRDEAGIIYCIRRKDVDHLAAELTRRGHRTAAYHAGLTAEDRRAAQDAFAAETCDIVVATVAFGMGIDRSNVRFVIHTGMPKSIEHYQQETGRSGRDGLAAECVLLYAHADAQLWKLILEKSSDAREHLANAFRQIDAMDRFCAASRCRHRSLVEHFGGTYQGDDCGACDVCLGDGEEVSDATAIAQKILSCVFRLNGSFGVAYVISVLRGERIRKVVERNHDALSTFGLLSQHSKEELREWIAQLVAQGLLRQEGDAYPLLRLTPLSRDVLRGEVTVRLVSPPGLAAAPRRSRAAAEEWEGVDRELFEALRSWRRETAGRKGVPPFVIFGDQTLRHLAAMRPSTREGLLRIPGIGAAKLSEYGAALAELITAAARARSLPVDCDAPLARAAAGGNANSQKEAAFAAFSRGASLEEVAALTGRARSTVTEYLTDYIREERPQSVAAWVSDARYGEIATAADEVGSERLRPIRERLGESVSYEEIRIVVTHLNSRL